MQTFASAQSRAAPPQTPPLQMSFTVQNDPSLQEAVLLAASQASVSSLQESSVQELSSEQSRAAPAWHAPALQVSFTVQNEPSSQDAVLFVASQRSVSSLQESSVQPLASSQVRAGPAVHAPSVQVSSTVQNDPSLQGVPLAASALDVHLLLLLLQVSIVHPLPSSQGEVPPPQAPAVHTSPIVQYMPSSQAVPSGVVASAGHAASATGSRSPQTSATSQAPPALVRQTVAAAFNSHLIVQQAPVSHCSLPSRMPLGAPLQREGPA